MHFNTHTIRNVPFRQSPNGETRAHAKTTKLRNFLLFFIHAEFKSRKIERFSEFGNDATVLLYHRSSADYVSCFSSKYFDGTFAEIASAPKSRLLFSTAPLKRPKERKKIMQAVCQFADNDSTFLCENFRRTQCLRIVLQTWIYYDACLFRTEIDKFFFIYERMCLNLKNVWNLNCDSFLSHRIFRKFEYIYYYKTFHIKFLYICISKICDKRKLFT